MNILHTVENYAPSVGGMQEVAGQLSRRLAALGHRVTVATSALPGRSGAAPDGVAIEEFAISGNPLVGYRGDCNAYRDFLRDSHFDIVTNFAAQQWATDLALPLLPAMTARKIFVPTGFSGLPRPQFAPYFADLPVHMRSYDAHVFLSHHYRDIEFARLHGIERRVVIPNGAAADEFEAVPTCDIRALLGIEPNHLLVLHVGSHTAQKGHAEAIEIFKRAATGPATLLIVGNRIGAGCSRRCSWQSRLSSLLPGSSRKRLRVAELTRPATVAAYLEADLFLFPSNIECSPLVLFECLASRTPFLTTDVGNAREIIDWTGGGLLLPTVALGDGLCRAEIEPSARMLESLAADGAERRALAAAGHAAWRRRFTWEHIANQYQELYQTLLEGNWPPPGIESGD